MERLDAVIFDLDGVLVDTVDLHFYAWAAVAKLGGRDLKPDEMEQLRGLRRYECLKLLFPDMELTPERIDSFVQVKHQTFISALSDAPSESILIDGAVELVESFVEIGIPIGIASSSVNAKRVTTHVGLASMFDVIVSGDMVARSKPFPDIFVWVAGALRANPQSCLVFEDSIAGSTGAKQAGMNVIGVANRDVEQDVDLYYRRLDEIDLADMFDQLGLSSNIFQLPMTNP